MKAQHYYFKQRSLFLTLAMSMSVFSIDFAPYLMGKNRTLQVISIYFMKVINRKGINDVDKHYCSQAI